MSAQDILGGGWTFPVKTAPHGGIAVAQGADDVKQAIRVILGTALGERAMRPDFGCAVHDLLFAPADMSLTGKARFYVRNALQQWEPRIKVDRVDAQIDANRLLIEVEYTVRATNRQENLVYPYYLQGVE